MRRIILNTSEVANMLAISTSTVKRWVKQLGLELGRNERGHLQFREEDIETLRSYQTSQGTLPQEIATLPEKQIRKGAINRLENTGSSPKQEVVKEQDMKLHSVKASKMTGNPIDSKSKAVHSINNPAIIHLKLELEHLNKRIDGKADSVTSYQLLQHRSEIEDLQNLVNTMANQIQNLELEIKNLKSKTLQDLPLVFDHPRTIKKPKKKNIISSFFGF